MGVHTIVTGVFGREVNQKLLLLAMSIGPRSGLLTAEEDIPTEIAVVTSVAGGTKAYCKRVNVGEDSTTASSRPTGGAGYACRTSLRDFSYLMRVSMSASYHPNPLCSPANLQLLSGPSRQQC